ncbi:PepSY-associated TM helix domain-containing protein [Pedobacter sp. P351]|uniref:PepSY-associated TM helix domain-containing protein n=1 Tax=Pedobacter superstes TaxID=3133441 RepID=UPI00309515D0
MTVKKISGLLHLWLGLASGIIVFIVSITGCIYVFEKEIKNIIEPWRFISSQKGPFLEPSKLSSIAENVVKGKKAGSLTYNGANEAVVISFFSRNKVKEAKAGDRYEVVYLNPYNGAVLKVKSLSRGSNSDFFRFVLNGHRALWLPYPIGRPIVGVSVLVFVIMLLSGIVLWWPRKWIRSIRDKSFKIKWNGSFKRANYDTHNVLGFYSCLFLLIISLTGLVWSFQWFSKSVYWLSSGGKSIPEYKQPISDTTLTVPFKMTAIDKIWMSLSGNGNNRTAMFISIPKKSADAIGISVYYNQGTYYKMDYHYFDQHSLKVLKADGPYFGKYADAGAADKLRRMNYDIHVGAILGLPGKILAFLASLISASLPVTGFLIWWGKRKKSKKRKYTGRLKPDEIDLNERILLKPILKRREFAINKAENLLLGSCEINK